MYKIEFNEEMTVEGILSSFKNLTEAKIESYIDIDGVRINWDDVNLEKRIKEEYIKYKEKNKFLSVNLKQTVINNASEKIDNGTKLSNEFDEILINRNDVYYLSKDPTFLFEIGIVLRYTKEEFKEDMLNYYISVYGNSSKNEKEIKLTQNLGYMANLLLIIEDDCTLIQKYYRIQQIINCISSDEDEKIKFEVAIKRVEKYAIHGDKIRDLLFLDILNDKLSQKNNELNKMLKHPLF